MLRDAWGELGGDAVTVNVLLVGDDRIRQLNRSHTGRDNPTDVLAFDDGDPDPETGVVHLGDIALSVDTARREAVSRKLRVRDEVTLYALHGLLHLCGMRDGDDDARAEMIRTQERYFKKHGLVFDMKEE